MIDRGVNLPLLIAQLFNLAIVAAWLLLALFALVQLGRRQLSGRERFAWATLIALVPILGASAFLFARPGQERHRKDER